MPRPGSCAALVVTAALAVGCFGQRPTRFYTLSPVADEVGGAAWATGASRVIAVGPVSIPDYVDRPQIVVRETGNEVQLATFDQWAGALDDMLSRVLIENLAARLPGDRIEVFPRVGATDFAYRVAVEVTRFDVGPAGEAVVAASWQVRDRTDGRTFHAASTTAQALASGKSYDERVAALSQAVGDLADAIAQVLARLPGDTGSAASR